MTEQQAPYDAIFFDLDGTLLPMKVRDFLEGYYKVLGRRLMMSGVQIELFLDALNRGLHAMGAHTADKTNDEAFWDVFLETYAEAESPLDEAQQAYIADLLKEFYETDFNQVGVNVVPDPAAARVVQTLHDKGYPLYLTTMPLFPREAVVARLGWAKVDPALFARITTFSNSTAVKPQLAYYLENLAIAGNLETPERVLMVGNDTIDDLNCLQVGMDAFLVTDQLINQNNFDIGSVKHGSLEELAEWVDTLPECQNTRALENNPNGNPLERGIRTTLGRDVPKREVWDREEAK